MQTTEYIKPQKKQSETLKGYFNYRIGQSPMDIFAQPNPILEREYIIFSASNFKKQTFPYYYKETYIGELLYELSYLLENIKKSESILLLEDNFDDNGGEKYSLETWSASIKFLLDYANTLFSDYNIKIDKPKIYNGPNGSIDLLWENKLYTLLINVHKNALDASFYAENNLDTLSIRGEFKLKSYIKALIPFAIKL